MAAKFQNFVFEGFDLGLDAEMAADPAESMRKGITTARQPELSSNG